MKLRFLWCEINLLLPGTLHYRGSNLCDRGVECARRRSIPFLLLQFDWSYLLQESGLLLQDE